MGTTALQNAFLNTEWRNREFGCANGFFGSSNIQIPCSIVLYSSGIGVLTLIRVKWVFEHRYGRFANRVSEYRMRNSEFGCANGFFGSSNIQIPCSIVLYSSGIGVLTLIRVKWVFEHDTTALQTVFLNTEWRNREFGCANGLGFQRVVRTSESCSIADCFVYFHDSKNGKT